MFYAAAMFPVLAGFLAGGIAALNLPQEIRGQAAMYLFDGENYWQTVSSVLTKRLVLLGIQAFFSIWILGMPVSLAAGICLQVSWSLPWVCMIRNFWQGVFIVIVTLPFGILHVLCGGYCCAAVFRHFAKLCREVALPKSSADFLREGKVPITALCVAGVIFGLCVLPEVFIYMNII